MVTTIGVLESNPPCPIITVGIARAAKNLERPCNMVVVTMEPGRGHTEFAKIHSCGLRIGIEHDRVEIVVCFNGGAGIADAVEVQLVGHDCAPLSAGMLSPIGDFPITLCSSPV